MNRFVLAVCLFCALGVAAVGQSFTPPCRPITHDRSITFCHPEGVTVTGTIIIQGWITDSLPHTSKVYLDGEFSNNTSDTFDHAAGRANDDKIHTLSIVVEDAQGVFQKTFSWRDSLQLPCAIPSSDRTIAICTPNTEEVGTSPVHFAGVARSSVPLRFLQVFLDGQGILNSSFGSSSVKLINKFAYIPLGRHRVTFQAKDVNGGTFKKTVFIEVVENP